jgi:cytoskeletal protein CcmA (bactofilin family)
VYDGTFQGNLTVSAGQNCAFLGGAINGNVTLNGGNLSLTNTEVGGNVQLNGGGTFSIGPSATIRGNLQVQNVPAGGQDEVCDTEVTGDVLFQDNGTAVQIGIGSADPTCTGNSIGGNLPAKQLGSHNRDRQQRNRQRPSFEQHSGNND